MSEEGAPNGGSIAPAGSVGAAAAPEGWTSCPGCGVALPDTAPEAVPRAGASAACWQLYGEVIGYELANIAALGRYHQRMVDAYAAQHPGADGPRITLAFALIGLFLAIERGWRGDEVRDAHQALARQHREWPRFESPTARGSLTVFDVALAGSVEAHAAAVEDWSAAVWSAWRPAHEAVATLVDRLLAPQIQGRLHAG